MRYYRVTNKVCYSVKKTLIIMTLIEITSIIVMARSIPD